MSSWWAQGFSKLMWKVGWIHPYFLGRKEELCQFTDRICQPHDLVITNNSFASRLHFISSSPGCSFRGDSKWCSYFSTWHDFDPTTNSFSTPCHHHLSHLRIRDTVRGMPYFAEALLGLHENDFLRVITSRDTELCLGAKIRLPQYPVACGVITVLSWPKLYTWAFLSLTGISTRPETTFVDRPLEFREKYYWPGETFGTN